MIAGKWALRIAFFAIPLIMYSCGSGKNLAGRGSSGAQKVDEAGNTESKRMAFLQKVSDNAVYAVNISSKIKFNIASGSKNITVSGTLRMRKDDVIRIQLTPLGLIEAGRIEFTKDYVMIMDRINKEYIKAAYNEVDFLRDNGIDFYALQAIFRNELFIPGEQKVKDSSLKTYQVDMPAGLEDNLIRLVRGKMEYVWKANKTTGRITSTHASYTSSTHGTTSLECDYSGFTSLGSKMFPTGIVLKMATEALKNKKNISIGIQMGTPDTEGGWESRTNVSGKYRQVSVEDVMKRILSL